MPAQLDRPAADTTADAQEALLKSLREDDLKTVGELPQDVLLRTLDEGEKARDAVAKQTRSSVMSTRTLFR